MKLDTRQSGDLTVNGDVTRTKKFDAVIDGKAFKLFSDTIYTNKIGSIVRELGCNALDSMRAANRGDVPFEVHVPNMFEPYFSVKDTGLGLSVDDVMDIYTTYFKSTKDMSNDAIGAFGLGSKTPFSYTDSFTLTSVYNGMKYHFAAITNESGEPTVSLLGEEKTTDHNGVEVIVSVDDSDYSSFEDEVCKQYRFFDTKPTVKNHSSYFEWSSNEIHESYGNFSVLTYTSQFFVVLGGVGYPLDVQHLSDKMDDKSPLEFFTAFSGGVLNFDIGDIEVTVSRESISYSKRTVNNIVNFIHEHAKIIGKKIIDSLNDMDNDWQRISFLNANSDARKIYYISDYRLGKNGNAGDGKLHIQRTNSYFNSKLYINPEKDMMDSKKTIRYNVSVASVDKRKFCTTEFSKNYIPKDNDVVFIRDKASSAIARLRHYKYEHPDENVIIFELSGNRTSADVDDKDIKHISRMLGGIEVNRVSELDKPPRQSRAHNKSPVMYGNGNNSSYFSLNKGWERFYDPEDVEKGYYIVYNKYPHLPNIEYLAYVLKMDLDMPIVAIKKERLDIIEGNPAFKPLEPKIEEIVNDEKKKIFGNLEIAHRLDMARFAVKHMETYFQTLALGSIDSNHIVSNYDAIMDYMKKTNCGDNMLKAITLFYRVTKYRDYNYNKFHNNIDSFHRHLLNNNENKKDLDEDHWIFQEMKKRFPNDEILKDKYPLLSYLMSDYYFYFNTTSSGNQNDKVAQIVQYINTIDNMNKD